MNSWCFLFAIVATLLKIGGSGYICFVIKMGSTSDQQSCLVGAYCGHAILTDKIGVYHCPFGHCFKKLENQKRGAS